MWVTNPPSAFARVVSLVLPVVFSPAWGFFATQCSRQDSQSPFDLRSGNPHSNLDSFQNQTFAMIGLGDASESAQPFDLKTRDKSHGIAVATSASSMIGGDKSAALTEVGHERRFGIKLCVRSSLPGSYYVTGTSNRLRCVGLPSYQQ